MRLQSSYAGTFYPQGPDELGETVEGLLRDAVIPPQRPLGALLPHAGYVYSGRTAGLAVGAFRGLSPATVVLLGPSHRFPIEGAAVVDVEGWETPLGPVQADQETARRLRRSVDGLQFTEPFAEHSLEVQLPLLKTVLPEAEVVAVAYGWPDLPMDTQIGMALADLAQERELIVVATSDLSHYHDQRTARRLDERFRELLQSGSAKALMDALARHETEACGAGPVMSLMEYGRMRGARFVVVDQRDSSAAYGDRGQVVGYLSALLLPEVGSEPVDHS